MYNNAIQVYNYFSVFQKKKMTDSEGAREEVKMNEEKEEQGEAMRQREESAGRRRRRRRGRLKHNELVVGKTVQTFRQQKLHDT